MYPSLFKSAKGLYFSEPFLSLNQVDHASKSLSSIIPSFTKSKQAITISPKSLFVSSILNDQM